MGTLVLGLWDPLIYPVQYLLLLLYWILLEFYCDQRGIILHLECVPLCVFWCILDRICSVPRRSPIPFFYHMCIPIFVPPCFFVYYSLSDWGCDGCLVEILKTPMPLVMKFTGLIFLSSIGSIWFGFSWLGGSICALGKIFQRHLVPQWSDSSTFGWLALMHLSCEFVGGPIWMLLIVVCQNIWAPLKLCCQANVLLVRIHCWLIHYLIFVATYNLFSFYVLKGFSDYCVGFITI